MRKKINLTNIGYWVFLTLLAIWPALYNQFPLVTSDSGAYIHSGIKLSLGEDRPWGYGIFLLLSTWGISIWGAVLAQGFIFAWLVHELCHRMLKQKANKAVVSLVVMLTTACTAAAWFNSQIMADAFTGLMLIAIVLAFVGDLSKPKRRVLNVLIFSCLLMHSSHAIVMLTCGIMLFFYFRKKHMREHLLVARRLIFMSVSAITLTCTIYALGGYGFRFSPVSHVFIISRMAENGILDEYLKDHCPVEDLSLCPYEGNTGARQWDFMWTGDYPHNKKGWLQARAEYNKIIYGSLKSPKFLGLHILKNTQAGLRQLSQIYVGDGLQPSEPGTGPSAGIEESFRYESKEFGAAVQNSKAQLPFTLVNFVTISFAFLAAATVLAIKASPERSAVTDGFEWPIVFGIAILFVVVNAFVTATFSTPIARLQTRIFWVLPLLCILFVYSNLTKVKTSGSDRADA